MNIEQLNNVIFPWIAIFVTLASGCYALYKQLQISEMKTRQVSQDQNQRVRKVTRLAAAKRKKIIKLHKWRHSNNVRQAFKDYIASKDEARKVKAAK